jgi:hypothetical protein
MLWARLYSVEVPVEYEVVALIIIKRRVVRPVILVIGFMGETNNKC